MIATAFGRMGASFWRQSMIRLTLALDAFEALGECA